MGHMALYRQFRPVTFDEIVEQKHAVAALRQSVITGQIGHAYLFCGTRGTGKTSIAKIFSRAINCLSPRNGNPCNECEICRGILDNTLMDVIEMDAASNNSVDNIRRICDEVMFLPSRAKYKVYIIDEVHMLSGGAFNALLKTLEEPPAHAVFILATTEPHRIPATIISRCQRYDFRRIPTESMVLRLQEIADAQQTVIDHDALVTISNLSDGALRDAISLLDQVSTGISRRITRDDVLRITGVVDDAFLYAMASALLTGDAPEIVTLTEQLVMDGRDMIRFTLDLAHYFRDLMVIRVTPDPENLVQATSDSMARMQELAGRIPAESLVFAITRLSGLVSELKWSPDMRTSFEIALLSFSAGQRAAGISGMLSALPAAASAPSRPAGAFVPAAPVEAPVDVPDEGLPTNQEINFHNVPSPSPDVKKADDSAGTRSRAYMPPPPFEDMFRAVPVRSEIPSQEAASPSPLTRQLSPTEANLQAPPEEDTYLPPPPFEIPSQDSVPPEATLLQAVSGPLADTREILPEPESADNSRTLPLEESWALLLHKWEDTIFSDSLQLKKAGFYIKSHVFYIVFPDSMQGYANSLTGRADYKKISKDILTVISGISSVEVQMESVRDMLLNPEDKRQESEKKAGAQPDWVAQMLAFSEATGIPVETLDNL